MSRPIIFTMSRGGAPVNAGYFRPNCIYRSRAPLRKDVLFAEAIRTDVEEELGNKKKGQNGHILRLVDVEERKNQEELMTVGRPWLSGPLHSAVHPADRRRGASGGRRSYRDIAHCDVSSYFWLIRAIMSPALIYVVIPPQQSCIDRS